MRPDRTWPEVARTSPGRNTDLAVTLLTYHTVAKDHAVPYPLATNPHLLITCKFSRSSDNQNEVVFKHVYLAGQAATMEFMHRCRTEGHATIRKRLGVNMFYTHALENTATVVTRKSEKHQGEWILT